MSYQILTPGSYAALGRCLVHHWMFVKALSGVFERKHNGRVYTIKVGDVIGEKAAEWGVRPGEIVEVEFRLSVGRDGIDMFVYFPNAIFVFYSE